MKRIAISSNGAVALGAYEAGVMAQLYADVWAVNTDPLNPIVAIDAIAGASAGAVTAALLAQAISVRAAPADLTSRMRDTWVTGLSVDALLGNTENDANSLYDPATFDTLAPEVLRNKAQMEAAVPDDSPTVALWIAITNLDGIPFEMPCDNGSIVADLYADYEPILIVKGLPYRAPAIESLKSPAAISLDAELDWDDIRETIIASGAFPFAFRSRMLERELGNYPGSIPPSEGANGMKFHCSDGGVLNNCPVGRAIDAACYLDRLSGYSIDDHTFLVIDPDPTTVGQAQSALSKINQTDTGDGLPPLPLIGSLIQCYFADAMYRDLQTATQTNQRLDDLEDVFRRLNVSGEDADAIKAAAGLGFKRRVGIEVIPQSDRAIQLAGAFFGHFGGFFDQRYREHDFAVGCQEARHWFTTWSGVELETALQGTMPANLGASAGFGGLNVTAFDHSKDLLSDRITHFAKGIAHRTGIFDPLVLLAVHRWVRQSLDHYLVDPPG